MVGAVGCGDGSIGGPSGSGGASVCGPNPPAFESFDMFDEGEVAEINGEQQRVVEVSALATDPDGDLHEYVVEIYVDPVVDGVLPSRPTFRVAGTAGVDDSCVVNEARVGAYIPFGSELTRDFGETIEIGFVVYDAAGNASHQDPPIIVRTLPEE